MPGFYNDDDVDDDDDDDDDDGLFQRQSAVLQCKSQSQNCADSALSRRQPTQYRQFSRHSATI